MQEHDDIAHMLTGKLVDFINRVPSLEERIVALNTAFTIFFDEYQNQTSADFKSLKASVLDLYRLHLKSPTDETVEDRQRRFCEIIAGARLKLSSLDKAEQEQVLLRMVVQLGIGLCGFLQTDLPSFFNALEKHRKERRLH
jgi:hypothetical protein